MTSLRRRGLRAAVRAAMLQGYNGNKIGNYPPPRATSAAGEPVTRRSGLRRFARGWAGRLALAAAVAAWGFAALAQSAPPKPFGFSVTLVETKGTLEAYVPSSTTVTSWDYRQRTGSNGNWGDWQKIVSSSWRLIASTGNLDRGKTYGFQVRAVNNSGEGPESDTKEVTVPAVAPPTPSSFTATAGDRQVTLSASIDTDGGSDITRWQYQQKTGSGGSYGKWKDIDSSKAKTSISTVIADLTNGTAYGFKIRAENGAGRGGESESGMVTPSTTPAAPTGLTATAGNGSVALSWTAGGNGGSAITGWKYTKKVGDNWDSDWEAVPNGGADTTRYTVPDLTNGTAYKFKVRAVNANGDGAESAESASAMPSAPVALSASGITHNAATLTVGNYSGDWYYKHTTPDGGACSSTAVTTASTAVSNLSGNTSYTFAAYSDSGCSSKIASASAFLTEPGQPAKPTTAAGAGSGKLTLSSSVTGGGALTKWQYTKDNGTNWTDIDVTSTTLSYTVSGLTDGTAYKFKVRAVNATGEGAVSDESDEATPRAPTQPPPGETQPPPDETLTAGEVTHDSAVLTIAGHSGAWHYKHAGGTCSSEIAVGTKTASVTGLTANTSYTFSAHSDGNCSTTALATAAAFTTLPPKPAKPTVAASGGGLALSSSVQGGEAALTRWEYKKKAGAGNFEANWTVIPSSTSKTLNHTVSGLEGGKSYAFMVRAVNMTGAGPESDASDAAALPAAAPAPAEAAHRKRLARIGRALAPEAARALASGAARAVSDRIRAVLSGDAGPPPGQALRAFVEARGEALSDGTASLGEALAGASFSLSAAEGGDAGGGASGAGLWAAGDWRALSGGARALDWDGGMAALHLGADTGFRRGLLGGLALSVSEAAFDYADRSGEEAVKGEWTARMTGVHPYAARLWEDGSRLWALLGYGAGEVEIDDGAAGRREADGAMASLAAGGALRLSPAEAGRPSLDLVADGFAARFETERSAGLPEAVEAEVSRLRVALAGAAALEAGPGAALAPSAELGLRWDGGDGETGFGAELGAGLSWSRPAAGLRLEAHARALLAHEGGVEEWGAGGLARLDPDGRGRGPSLSLRPSFGHAGSGAARLWEEGVAGRGPEDGRPAARLEAEAGYGLAAPGAAGALLTPWAGVGLEDGGARRYGAGLRLERGPDAALGLEAARAGPERALTLTYRIRW